MLGTVVMKKEHVERFFVAQKKSKVTKEVKKILKPKVNQAMQVKPGTALEACTVEAVGGEPATAGPPRKRSRKATPWFDEETVINRNVYRDPSVFTLDLSAGHTVHLPHRRTGLPFTTLSSDMCQILSEPFSWALDIGKQFRALDIGEQLRRRQSDTIGDTTGRKLANIIIGFWQVVQFVHLFGKLFGVIVWKYKHPRVSAGDETLFFGNPNPTKKNRFRKVCC